MDYQELKKVLQEAKNKIDPAIKELLEKYVEPEHRQLVDYQVSTGGKRIRPTLAITSCRALGGKLKHVLYPAAGLEILHNCTLIIDDIIDNSSLRRGKPTMWKKFGSSVAQCMALNYAFSVFQVLKKSEYPIRLSQLFARTMKTVCDGEILDILFEQTGRKNEPYVVENRYRSVSEEEWFKMVSKKTALLLQTCCEIGGICADADEKEINALQRYGFHLGMAFQIRDDMLDIFGETKKFGKAIGKDIEEAKLGNIVLLYAFEQMKKENSNELLNILRKQKVKKKDILRAMDFITKTKARKKAMKKGKQYKHKAKKALNSLPENKWKRLLTGIADFVMEREK